MEALWKGADIRVAGRWRGVEWPRLAPGGQGNASDRIAHSFVDIILGCVRKMCCRFHFRGEIHVVCQQSFTTISCCKPILQHIFRTQPYIMVENHVMQRLACRGDCEAC